MWIWKAGMIGAVVVMLTKPPYAQVSSFQASIPFPFVVGKQTLPAGTYVVQRFLGKPKKAEDVGLIVMKTSDHHVYKVIVTAAGEGLRTTSDGESKLIFTNFKGREYLNQVCVAGDAVVHQVANVPPEGVVRGNNGEVIVTGLRNTKSK